MASIQPSSNVYSTMREMHWSSKERTIARRAFDRALHRELDATIQEAKQMAKRIKKPEELWELERHLTQRRKEIDRKYDFKYSVVLLVLGELVRAGNIDLDELRGLSDDKLSCVRGHAQLAA